MRYSLRTLLILTTLGPPAISAAWLWWDSMRPKPLPPDKPYYIGGQRFILDVF